MKKTSIGTMSGNNEDVPPHLFATAIIYKQ